MELQLLASQPITIDQIEGDLKSYDNPSWSDTTRRIAHNISLLKTLQRLKIEKILNDLDINTLLPFSALSSLPEQDINKPTALNNILEKEIPENSGLNWRVTNLSQSALEHLEILINLVATSTLIKWEYDGFYSDASFTHSINVHNQKVTSLETIIEKWHQSINQCLNFLTSPISFDHFTPAIDSYKKSFLILTESILSISESKNSIITTLENPNIANYMDKKKIISILDTSEKITNEKIRQFRRDFDYLCYLHEYKYSNTSTNSIAFYNIYRGSHRYLDGLKILPGSQNQSSQSSPIISVNNSTSSIKSDQSSYSLSNDQEEKKNIIDVLGDFQGDNFNGNTTEVFSEKEDSITSYSDPEDEKEKG